MKSASYILCTVTLLLGVLESVQADYHVSKYIDDFQSCPSDYYKCACFAGGDRKGIVYTDSKSPPGLGSKFYIESYGGKFCGYGRIDHYLNPDGKTYSAFVAGGNGKVIATCYPADSSKGTIRCPKILGTLVHDYLICYGQPCQP